MNPVTAQLLLVGGLVAYGAVLLILPRIARRGLLFGVYVAEEGARGGEAVRITRGWYVGMVAALIASAAVGEWLTLRHPGEPLGGSASLALLGALTPLVYLRAHLQARAIAAPGAPAAVAALVPDARRSLLFPLIAVGAGILGGLVSIVYAWVHYGDLPAMIPTHFGAERQPDVWSPRSFWSVMLLPLTALVLGTALGVMACLIARAKRAIRFPDRGISVQAQLRFRQAMANFVSGVVVLVTLMLTLMSVYSVRTAMGLAPGLPPAIPFLLAIMLTYALGGTLFLALRYGQGGARLERAAGAAPLTNGLADNARWVLGMFYVNRDDPSLFVEKRFGFGYTLNFGNPRAIALLATLLIIVFAMILIGVFLPHARVPR